MAGSEGPGGEKGRRETRAGSLVLKGCVPVLSFCLGPERLEQSGDQHEA